MINNKKGFTLLELMLVVVILGILIAISIAIFPGIAGKASETTCEANRYLAIRAFQRLQYTEIDLTLDDMLTDDDHEYFTQDIACPEGGVLSVQNNTIVCSIHGAASIDTGSSASYVYDFANMTQDELEDLMAIIITHDRDEWDVTEVDGRLVLTNDSLGENRVFFPLEFDEYTIVTNVQLEGSNGYGIMVEAITGNDANDSGFIFQFDAGYSGGEFVFRERSDGKEYSPFARIEPEDVIPGYDPDTYWNEEHEVEIDIFEYSETQNQMVVRIDGIEITA
ncbi:MAG: type II secretion system protein [Clostridia bacterium]|nr:type II secretion system protein [Clostridia bacterium]